MAETIAEQAAPVAETKAPVVDKAAEPTEEYIVNGKPVQLSKSQAKAYVQKGMFADQKLKSMEVLKEKSTSLLNSLKTEEGILNVAKELGISHKALVKRLLASENLDDEIKEEIGTLAHKLFVVDAKKSPEQLENEKKLTEYEKMKKQEEDRKLADLSEQQKQQVQAVYTAIRAEVTKQIVADKTFPQTEGSIRAVVEKLRVMNKQGAAITTENVGKAINLVKKDHLLHQQELFDKIEDPEALIAFFGEDRALKISKALVARLRNTEKAKLAEAQKSGQESVREKVTDRIDKKLGRTAHGYSVMDV